MKPFEITETGVRFQGEVGLVLFILTMLILIFIFRWFMFLMAGKAHRKDWVIQLLVWGGTAAFVWHTVKALLSVL